MYSKSPEHHGEYIHFDTTLRPRGVNLTAGVWRKVWELRQNRESVPGLQAT
jgi:hypothetical protein